jgi:uncharacterized membrane protein (UPF0127 family)
MKRWVLLGGALFGALLLAACSASPGSTTTAAAPDTTTTAAPALPGFETSTIQLDDRELLVAVADTPEARRRGLMGVTDLGELNGMLFVWEGDTTEAFWMKDTPIPLDIAFFTVGGGFVDRLTMEPCVEDPCELYSASTLYRYAIEAPQGDLAFVGPGSQLVVGDG